MSKLDSIVATSVETRSLNGHPIINWLSFYLFWNLFDHIKTKF